MTTDGASPTMASSTSTIASVTIICPDRVQNDSTLRTLPTTTALAFLASSARLTWRKVEPLAGAANSSRPTPRNDCQRLIIGLLLSWMDASLHDPPRRAEEQGIYRRRAPQ